MNRPITIDSPETMLEAIRYYGVIPFFHNLVPGWSIEELTAKEYWFFESDELGPWDWKIDMVRDGDIAYGKFIHNKAAFATTEFYRHFMNWRRSMPRYRMALGEKFNATNINDKLMKGLSPTALEFVKENGSAEIKDIRAALASAVTPSLIRSVGAKYKPSLQPSVKKSIGDSLMIFLEMGTWCVVGDFTRVYRGANLEYSGWQRTSFTTPESMFGSSASPADSTASADKPKSPAPFWASMFDDSDADRLAVDCTPEESYQFLLSHLLRFFPDYKAEIEKMLLR